VLAPGDVDLGPGKVRQAAAVVTVQVGHDHVPYVGRIEAERADL
jgi:hypothetical protein